ncbi:carbohydrate ABC transporter permease [Marinicellulosiphila megalodicopiae]|uniref:carbohydrate ABC transporter permease n=1 Tax=Marinicellulosiphila megalodicopiae TaxID=2724896 RepID=UPI003BAFDBF7
MSRNPGIGTQGSDVSQLEIPAPNKLKKILSDGTPYWFLSPWMILYGIFGIFPLFFMVFLSFQDWNPSEGMGAMQFVGTENYVKAFTDPLLYGSMWNTLCMAVMSGVPQHLFAIPMAYILVQLGERARHWFTSAYFLPYITSTVAVSMIFFMMFQGSGIINSTITVFHDWSLTAPFFTWFDPDYPIQWVRANSVIQYSISMVVFWKYLGFNIVIYSAGMATISTDLYEAAKIDGANTFQRFTQIALPLLKPFIFFGVTMTIIGNMNLFDEPFVLTNGLQSATDKGMTISNYLFRVAWQQQAMGMAAAISWILFAVIATFTAIYFFLFGREGLQEGQ